MINRFGQIYGGNNPTHGVYLSDSVAEWGRNAKAISHHWSESAAKIAKEASEYATGHAHVIVAYGGAR